MSEALVPDAILEIADMNRSEATGCLIAIRGNLTSAAEKAADFELRNGWKALGYESFEACLLAEFGHPTLQAFIQHELKKSQSQSYRLAATNKVATNIQTHTGTAVTLKERWVRDSGITDLPPAQQAEADTIARSIAGSERSSLTANHYIQAVQQIKIRETVFQSVYAVVSLDVASGKLTADVGNEFVKQLDALKEPKRRGYVIELMARFGLTCPELVSKLADLFDRPPGQESYILPEVQFGFLGGKPLAQATMSDWKKAAYEAQQRHIADAAEEKRNALLVAGQPVIEDVTLTLPKGDWKKCIAILRKELGDNGFEYLMRAGMEI